eukprot:6189779-Pleurochrysis_carterae.AAC.3
MLYAKKSVVGKEGRGVVSLAAEIEHLYFTPQLGCWTALVCSAASAAAGPGGCKRHARSEREACSFMWLPGEGGAAEGPGRGWHTMCAEWRRFGDVARGGGYPEKALLFWLRVDAVRVPLQCCTAHPA